MRKSPWQFKMNIGMEPPPPGVLWVLEQLRQNGHEAVLVGGGVRDRLLGRQVDDWDIATSAVPEAVMHAFSRVVPTGIDHGTVTVVHDGQTFEVTTYRVEGGYSDARRPDSVSYTADLLEDLSRRDFTINAMAWDPQSAVLYDPFDGQADLADAVLRAVGDPVERLTEDGLRALRAVRFACVLGFELESGLRAAIPQTRESFEQVSMERIYAELVKMVPSENIAQGIKELYATGLLSHFMPERVAKKSGLETVLAALVRPPKSSDGRWAVICHDLGAGTQGILIGMKFPKKRARLISRLVAHSSTKPEALNDSEALFELVSSVGRHEWSEYVSFMICLYGSQGWRDIQSRVNDLNILSGPLTEKELALDGSSLMAGLGMAPSPAVGQMLNDLLRAVWRNPELNDKEALIAEARRLRKQPRENEV